MTNTRRAIRAAIYGAVLLVALLAANLATRGTDGVAAIPSRHEHGAVGGGGSRIVALTRDQERRIGVTFAEATVGALEHRVRTVGEIVYDETRVRAIAPKIDGWVEQLFVNTTGQPVSVGQPLLTIYSPMLVTAQEELLLATQLESDVAGGSDEARRSAADLLVSARSRLAAWDIPASEIAEVERTGHSRRTLTLRSPAGGFVLEKNVLAGQRVMAGDALFKVADLRTVWVEGNVFERDLANVRVGQVVHADFQALPDEHRMGRIAYIYPMLEPTTRTAKVRVVLSNDDLRLKPGMYATLRIAGVARRDVLTVPRGAVLSTGERDIVFVRDARGRLASREVALGDVSDERVEILRGLTAGETVVASGTFLVDAESNLEKALGGMGNMPGMDVGAPPAPLPMQPTGRSPQPTVRHAPEE
jgi:RND family efflux transporter MFP subunit